MLALYIVAGTILLVILVLSVPVDLTFDVATDGDGRRKLRVGWLFGLVGKDLLPRKKKRPPKVKKEKKAKEKKRPPKVGKKGKRPGLSFFLSVLRTRGLVDGAVRLVRRMLRSLRVRELDGRLRVGLPDPADTGMVYGVLWSAFLLRSPSRAVRFQMEPAFEGPAFEVSLQGTVRVIPAQVAANAVRFVVSPPGLRVIKLMVVLWWKKRK